MRSVDVRRALLDELSQIQDKEVALLLSGGIGSQSVLFALLELEKTVTCYTFTLDDRQSTDFVNAKRTAHKFACAFVPVYLPTDISTLRADLLVLRQLGAVSKTDYECGWPMLYAYQQIGERQIVSGLGDDDHFAISKKAMIHYKERIQAYRDYMMFNVGAPQKAVHDALCERHGKMHAMPYMSMRVYEEFRDSTWDDVNRPRVKSAILNAFEKQFARVTVNRPMNYQKGDSGIATHFENLITDDDRARGVKSVVTIYNRLNKTHS